MIVKRIKNGLKRRIIHAKRYGSVWNYLHGFYQETRDLNGINKNNYKSFLDDRRYMLGHPYNGHFSSIIDNKIYLPYLLKDFPENIPHYYFYITNGKIKSMNKALEDGFDSFICLLNREKTLALKQCYSSFGKGFYVIEKSEKGRVRINKKDSCFDDLKMLFSEMKDYVCTEYVRQHEYSMKICSTSLNTIRFLCVRDEEEGVFFVARCFHRFGIEGSVVDNLGGGNGYLFLVDKDTGILKSNGAKNVENKGEVYLDKLDYPKGLVHGGMLIPNYHEVKQKIIQISNSIPFLRYIGWDVAITNDGFKIIEANSLTSLGVLQRDGGFLDDEKLCKFYFTKL